ncbi:MAG TPA: aspartyl/asparaginyl beta-hydroxylase domain-containing protein [Gemmataceae bacterium]|nr:aspartyl/asparaginyl beta-hydroxylase domain-containing protein [Gemmataceae bacterium]
MRALPHHDASCRADSRHGHGRFFTSGPGNAHQAPRRLRRLGPVCPPLPSRAHCQRRLRNARRARDPEWQAGKVTIFCDATEHEVWNRGTTERVVLLLDFRNPAFRWRLLNPELTPDMQSFISAQWHELSVGDKLGYIGWRLLNYWRKPRTYVDEVHRG